LTKISSDITYCFAGSKPKEESSSFAGTAMVHEGKSFYIDEEM